MKRVAGAAKAAPHLWKSVYFVDEYGIIILRMRGEKRWLIAKKSRSKLPGQWLSKACSLAIKNSLWYANAPEGKNHHRSQLKCLQKAYCNLRSTNSLYMFSLCASVHLRIRVAKLCTYSHALLFSGLLPCNSVMRRSDILLPRSRLLMEKNNHL